MRFLSTRGGRDVTAAQAIQLGISPDGGLFVPESFPAADLAGILKRGSFYQGIAYDVMIPYLEGFTHGEVLSGIESAYSRFGDARVVPLVPLTPSESVLELWYGPTMAFKDVALQMLPHLLTQAVAINGDRHVIYILVATSGDTGKAALEGFCDVPGTRVTVFYPHGGVSAMQRLQMVTQAGKNVSVCAVRGNFDDAQTGVKKIFGDRTMAASLGERGFRLSSANSINFGRLVPQIAYYFSAYAQLAEAGTIRPGQLINFCVPTGNFGDILAGYYAVRMGLPVNRLILAANRNNVLTDFFRTGVYDARRPFSKSMSCSIDILISSNLERLLFELADRDPSLVKEWMASLSETGRYDIGIERISRVSSLFWSSWCSEEETLRTIAETFNSSRYLMDPHTAVAQKVYGDYVRETGDDGTHTVLLSTASPYKFPSAVLSAFTQPSADEFADAERLFRLSGMPMPAQLAGLRGREERFTDVCDLAEMPAKVLECAK